MKKVLFIAHYFPPLNAPGTNRSLQFVKNLGSLGYSPVVLTINEKAIRNNPYPSDVNLNEQIPSNVNVVQIKTFEPLAIKKILMKLRIFRPFWFIFYPLFWENAALWPFPALSKARK
jgi:hypothetical protein